MTSEDEIGEVTNMIDILKKSSWTLFDDKHVILGLAQSLLDAIQASTVSEMEQGQLVSTITNMLLLENQTQLVLFNKIKRANIIEELEGNDKPLTLH